MKLQHLHIVVFLLYSVAFSFAELPEKTLSNLNQAAESDDPKAQFYLYCLNIETNKELAEIWLRKSATNNYAEAQNTLGLFIDEQNNNQSAEAYTWYRKAANQGHAHAQPRNGGQRCTARLHNHLLEHAVDRGTAASHAGTSVRSELLG